ncbi:MAG: RidA family protein [Phycisphaeraceae bacterium]|nr:RidA family protein [Phycisphaeraceae bacterium]
MSHRDAKLESLGYPLDKVKYTPGGIIEPLSVDGDTMYLSGQVPFDGEDLKYVGKVPSKVSVEDASKAAALCAANLLRVARKYLGTLDRVDRVLRITGYVNADPSFTDCHVVINGATNLIREVLGQPGRHARTALGMGQLPLGVSVEVEMILKIKN